MNRDEAIAIFNSGQQRVVNTLLEMDTEIINLKKIVNSQEMKIAKLSKNSSNSGKKPSSDDITKPKNKKKNEKNRKIGGQKGHPKHERPLFPQEDIDKFHHHWLDYCPICNADVIFIYGEPRITQQIEIQEIVTQREEHRAYPFWCEKCQKIHYAPFPPEVVKEGLFKARITALGGLYE